MPKRQHSQSTNVSFGVKIWKFFVSFLMGTSIARVIHESANFASVSSAGVNVNSDNQSLMSHRAILEELYQNASQQTQQLLTPFDRPPLDEYLYVVDNNVAFDTSKNDWNQNSQLEEQFQWIKKERKIQTEYHELIVDKLIDEVKNLKINPEINEFLLNSEGMQAVTFLANLVDIISDFMLALQARYGTKLEFATLSGALTSCLMAREQTIHRVELITAIRGNDQRSAFQFVAVNRSTESKLEKLSEWGNDCKIIFPWLNNNNSYGIYSSKKPPRLLSKLSFEEWSTLDITPPDLTEAPEEFIEFFNGSIKRVIDYYSKNLPGALERFSSVCDLNSFKHPIDNIYNDDDSETLNQFSRAVL